MPLLPVAHLSWPDLLRVTACDSPPACHSHNCPTGGQRHFAAQLGAAREAFLSDCHSLQPTAKGGLSPSHVWHRTRLQVGNVLLSLTTHRHQVPLHPTVSVVLSAAHSTARRPKGPGGRCSPPNVPGSNSPHPTASAEKVAPRPLTCPSRSRANRRVLEADFQ